MNHKRYKKRMTRAKKIIICVILFCVAGGFMVGYAFYVEPNRLVVRNISVDYGVSDFTEQVKIVQFSDTHLGDGYSLKQLERAVDKINEQNGDFVIFTGDLMDKAFSYTEQDEAVEILSKIEAKVNKIAVWGNHDIGGGGIRIYGQMMENAGFILLKNESIRVPIRNENDIVFTGLDDGMLGEPDENAVPERKRKGDFHVLVSHEPDIATRIDTKKVDLTLSGHSHGGQIKLPFIGPLVKVPLAKIYTHGMYQLDNGKLYVNTGLGTTKINVRLFNPPVITVLELDIF